MSRRESRQIVVVGSGLRGLIVAWVLRQHPIVDVVIVGDHGDRHGAESAIDEIPRATRSLRSLLQAVSVPHSVFRPRTGVLLRNGRVRARKGSDERSVRRLRFSGAELAEALLSGAARPRIHGSWSAQRPGLVRLNGSSVRCDFLVLALLADSHRVWFDLPRRKRRRRGPYAAVVKPTGRTPYLQWEEVLTPRTPARAVSRLVCCSGVVIVEASDDGTKLAEDLRYLFPGGWQLAAVRASAPERQPAAALPENVAMVAEALPLGTTIDLSYELLRRWTVERERR